MCYIFLVNSECPYNYIINLVDQHFCKQINNTLSKLFNRIASQPLAKTKSRPTSVAQFEVMKYSPACIKHPGECWNFYFYSLVLVAGKLQSATCLEWRFRISDNRHIRLNAEYGLF